MNNAFKISLGALNPIANASDITVTMESMNSSVIDGGRRIGMAVMSKSVDVALEIVARTGISIVSATNYSSATGAIGCWTRKIANAGYIGIAMSQVNMNCVYH